MVRKDGVSRMVKIKICGLFREYDIDYVNEAKPDYAGFILYYPKSHRNISVEEAARLRRRLLPEIKAVGVLVDQPPDLVARAATDIPLDIVQLHGSEDDSYMALLKDRIKLPVWKAFRIRNKEDLQAALESSADKILLDGGSGAGVSFDWTHAADMKRPFILAGGLSPANIPEAVRMLSPEGIDLSSGVETDKVKDRDKILAVVREVRKMNGVIKKEKQKLTGKEGEDE